MWTVLLRKFSSPNVTPDCHSFRNLFARFKDVTNGGARRNFQTSSPSNAKLEYFVRYCGRPCRPLVFKDAFNPSRFPVLVRGKGVNLCQPQRCFRTTPRRDALPPFVVMLLGRLAKLVAMLLGRTVRRWWQKLPPEGRAVYAKKVRRNRYIISGLLGATAFGSYVYYDSHVQETPFTNRKRFLAFTNAQIFEMAKLELETLLQLNEGRIIPARQGSAVYRRIVRVAQQLLNANQDLSQIHDLEWTVTVVEDDSQMNAFVLPCGSIFVFSGLLKLCDSDDQLGIILGHEMAHAVMGHGAEKASFVHFMDLMFIIPLAALWALLPTDITAAVAHWITSKTSEILMDLPHSRFIEEEADEVGLVLAAKACFDIREAPVVWAKMGLLGKDDISIEWLSTIRAMKDGKHSWRKCYRMQYWSERSASVQDFHLWTPD
ncbi:Metalloendopeptidase OMA1, mitochondrial [Orchesella cincta]|uniref:Metalloendopeptidase OMA1, mitochondrial n=1 Tax=Orchesella cincta TaxID=48709 RepID=A0A1D2MZG0_ORCCI|nr:Metalloendopeptidase OMA1, mitochondrial [Orchesella cincta]